MSLIVHMHAYYMTADLYNRLQCFWPKITLLVSVHAHDCIFRHNPIGQPNGDVLKSLKERKQTVLRADSISKNLYLKRAPLYQQQLWQQACETNAYQSVHITMLSINSFGVDVKPAADIIVNLCFMYCTVAATAGAPLVCRFCFYFLFLIYRIMPICDWGSSTPPSCS